MSWTVIEADGNGVRETRSGGTLTGQVEVEMEAKQKSLAAFRSLPPDYTPLHIAPWQVWGAYSERSAKQKPEPKPEPEPASKPKPKMITWRLCVRLRPNEIDHKTLVVKWHPSGDIPEHWYPIEAQSQPVETIQQLPEVRSRRLRSNE